MMGSIRVPKAARELIPLILKILTRVTSAVFQNGRDRFFSDPSSLGAKALVRERDWSQ
jgi:hypothetical protein